ncbi:MAG TPA: hypothetical protein VKT82_34585 [Ktedonobacterales bacterium]|nr:hypothetical protein [Ktedonobacterales bacterium]
MRDRFDRFTPEARKVLSLAQEEAQHFQHNYIGPERSSISTAWLSKG